MTRPLIVAAFLLLAGIVLDRLIEAGSKGRRGEDGPDCDGDR